MMTATVPASRIRRLESIHNRRTAYEVAAIHPDGRRVLIGYTPRKSRQGLWEVLTFPRQRAEAMVELTGSGEFIFAAKAADGGSSGDWAIRFTGRTEREAILEGELPYVHTA